jgi:hypothetical protein
MASRPPLKKTDKSAASLLSRKDAAPGASSLPAVAAAAAASSVEKGTGKTKVS